MTPLSQFAFLRPLIQISFVDEMLAMVSWSSKGEGNSTNRAGKRICPSQIDGCIQTAEKYGDRILVRLSSFGRFFPRVNSGRPRNSIPTTVFAEFHCLKGGNF